jgi:hypothetical protein
MQVARELDRRMAIAGSISGLAGVAAYFGAAFLPAVLPVSDGVVLALAFAFGPLPGLSFLGLFHAIAAGNDGPALRFGVVLGILAGATVTTMLVVQVGNNIFLDQQLAEADAEVLKESARLVHRTVNRVQMLIDVAWDVFICSAGFLIGFSMFRHPAFGRILGGTGMVASAALLYLNLDTFPRGPAYAGSVDLGPLLAVWFLIAYVRVLWLTRTGQETA